MLDRIKTIILKEYNINVDEIDMLNVGYYSDETYLLNNKYIVKYIRYNHKIELIKIILKFENVLCKSYEYPCPQIILTKNEEILIEDNDRILFVQTFIQGFEPNKDFINQNENYLTELGRLLAKLRLISNEYSVNISIDEEEKELTEKWWNKQQIDNIDPFLLTNYIQCKNILTNLKEDFQHGIIHNDFHSNNSLITNNGNIFIIDFIDGIYSLFLSDLSTSIFHLLTDRINGIKYVKSFINGYQQIIQLTSDEINILDIFVRLKLTLSIIQDLHHSNDPNDTFIQSCFQLLHQLNQNPTLVKNLFQ